MLAFRPGAAQSPPPTNWYKGNLHTHTINSDGDSPPYEVMAWYKRNGYQFLAITDHNTFTDPALFDTNESDNFLLIGAEEVTNEKTVHVNAIGVTKVIPPQPGSTVTAILQASIDAIRAQRGVALINHPNFRWAFTAVALVRHRFGSIVDRPDAGLFVAQDAVDRVIGWVHVYGTHLLESESHAEIAGLVVAEEVRGHGVGRALVAAAEAWAERHGYGTVRVRSNVARVHARGFYEHLGYAHVKTQNNFRKVLLEER